MAAFAVLIGLYPLMYFIIDVDFGLLSTKSVDLLENHAWQRAFYLHIAFGGISLLTGWFQFVSKWRNQWPKLHRRLGYLYVSSVIISGISGFFVSWNATGGLIASFGFGSLSILWLLFTSLALWLAIKRQFELHRKAMIFSYAATFAAVTLRLWLPILVPVYGDFIPAYQVVSWLCWVPNLIFAWWLVKKRPEAQDTGKASAVKFIES
ncbi:DUF2306 domain-containing protein [Sanyastnella coralliicola]|uniref:DUF2306 domain-containing protein n=1 Tax=Sanyastnella coralliicola TaxID=3069118 RepID=UPI0027BA02BD|nr:DUF2306 domain-containing protein [Longitalea sp. SCSIO 12813]